jgi:hypothetical protein
MVKAPRRLFEEVVWRQFNVLHADLWAYLEQTTERLIRDTIHADAADGCAGARSGRRSLRLKTAPRPSSVVREVRPRSPCRRSLRKTTPPRGPTVNPGAPAVHTSFLQRNASSLRPAQRERDLDDRRDQLEHDRDDDRAIESGGGSRPPPVRAG